MKKKVAYIARSGCNLAKTNLLENLNFFFFFVNLLNLRFGHQKSIRVLSWIYKLGIYL